MGLVPAATAITETATAFAFPPTAIAWVSQWNSSPSTPKSGHLEWSAAVDTDVTAARLYGLRLISLVNADDTFTAANSTEIFTASAHGLLTGDGPFRVSNSGGALPTGLSAGTDYWIIKIDANTFYLAASLADAFVGSSAKVLISADGTGTHTIADTADTKRVKFDSFGLLGDAVDGAFSVSAAGLAYRIVFDHLADVVGYAVSCSLSGANAQRIYVTPDVR